MLPYTGKLRVTLKDPFSQLGDGGMELLGTPINPRGQVTVTLPEFSTVYDIYMIELSNLICPVDHHLIGQAGAPGPTFPAGSLDHESIGRAVRDTAAADDAAGIDNGLQDFFSFNAFDNSSPGATTADIEGNERYSGTIWLFDPLGPDFTYMYYNMIYRTDIAAGNVMGARGANCVALLGAAPFLRLAPLGLAATNWSDVADQEISTYGLTKSNPLFP